MSKISREKVNLTVKMNVTIPQALALQAMFEAWNKCSGMGHSQFIAFFVDGDGNFHPKCEVSVDKEIPELTDELRKLASDEKWEKFDFDNIAWSFED